MILFCTVIVLGMFCAPVLGDSTDTAASGSPFTYITLRPLNMPFAGSIGSWDPQRRWGGRLAFTYNRNVARTPSAFLFYDDGGIEHNPSFTSLSLSLRYQPRYEKEIAGIGISLNKVDAQGGAENYSYGLLPIRPRPENKQGDRTYATIFIEGTRQLSTSKNPFFAQLSIALHPLALELVEAANSSTPEAQLTLYNFTLHLEVGVKISR